MSQSSGFIVIQRDVYVTFDLHVYKYILQMLIASGLHQVYGQQLLPNSFVHQCSKLAVDQLMSSCTHVHLYSDLFCKIATQSYTEQGGWHCGAPLTLAEACAALQHGGLGPSTPVLGLQRDLAGELRSHRKVWIPTGLMLPLQALAVANRNAPGRQYCGLNNAALAVVSDDVLQMCK